VKKDIMQKKYQEGGLKMINIHSFILALNSTWIRRLFFNNCKWQNIFMSSIDINKLSCGGNGYIEQVFLFRIVYISFEPLELQKIFCRDDGTKGVCKLDDLSPYGYNFNICRKELITSNRKCKKSILEGCNICLEICY
jgi:hypothetical protein